MLPAGGIRRHRSESCRTSTAGATILPAPAHDDGGCVARVRRLAEQGVRTVIAPAIGSHAWAELRPAGITVHRNLSSRSVAALVEALERGQLPRFDPKFSRPTSCRA
jgi:predicted Fe-Mo cluster-binding NifX family protein